jgi:Flp pilus assembly protein TadG
MKVFVSNRQQAGQTLIETALVLFLILMILLGIAEFSRAWFTKNSIKNAARQGARVAAVESGITTELNRVSPEAAGSGLTPSDCVNLTGKEKVFCTIWSSPGIITDSNASIPKPTASLTINGDTITVDVTMRFKFLVPNFVVRGLALPSTLSASATMRSEG